VLCVLSLAAPPSAAQAPAIGAPRTAKVRPELSGIWQALNTADWDLEGQAAAAGAVPRWQPVFAKPARVGVVKGGEIPYLPAMAAKKKENQANWVKLARRSSVICRVCHAPPYLLTRFNFQSQTPS